VNATDALRLDLKAARDALQKRELTSVDLTEAAFNRVSELDPELHAFVTLDHEGALQSAALADQEIADGRLRPLQGVPVAVKDNIAMRGLRTTFNSRAYEQWLPTQDAEPVARLREAGAVILGKTNLNEFALSVPDATDLVPPPRNPWNRNLQAMGSSSGSAVAVSTGMCFAALGTDAGGSVRLPASQMGLVGLKPTRGALPGAEGILDEVSVVGILARHAADALAMYEVLAGSQDIEDPGSPLELAVPRRQIDELPIEDEAAQAFASDLETLVELGVRLVEVDLPYLEAARDANFLLMTALQHASRAEDLRERYALIGTSARRYFLGAGMLGIEDFFSARRVADIFSHDLKKKIAGCTGLVTPVSTVTSAEAARRPGEHGRGLDASFTSPFNAIGWPAISIPTRIGTNGLPIGMQVVGRPGQDGFLLGVAGFVQQNVDSLWTSDSPLFR
jgi:aspartyl-tRNA(Asn)/glutamyl-tRNA(Gln) amidotransferase subunit A